LIILDIKMPIMDGFTLYDALKEKDSKAKICFLTASEMFYERYRKSKYSSLEKDLFLRKPISNEHLVEEIMAFMAM
jgi:CheY-like chemotaxis protein